MTSVFAAKQVREATPDGSRQERRHPLTDVTIVVSPALDCGGRRRAELFEARLLGSSMILCVSRQPLLDVARTLLGRGMPSQTVLSLVHDSNQLEVALRAPIGIAAKYDVMGSRFVRRNCPARPDALGGPMRGAGMGLSDRNGALRPEQGCGGVRVRHNAGPDGTHEGLSNGSVGAAPPR
jgi:hypothetical protein